MEEIAPRSALVVDDDRAVAAVLSAFLSRLGLEVTTAHHRDDAERLLESHSWSLLVTDLQLQGPRGAEGLDLIRLARARCPDIRTILVSGAARPDLTLDAAGADSFLAKPVTLGALGEQVRALLPSD